MVGPSAFAKASADKPGQAMAPKLTYFLASQSPSLTHDVWREFNPQGNP
jgi:hypothetical protein